MEIIPFVGPHPGAGPRRVVTLQGEGTDAPSPAGSRLQLDARRPLRSSTAPLVRGPLSPVGSVLVQLVQLWVGPEHGSRHASFGARRLLEQLCASGERHPRHPARLPAIGRALVAEHVRRRPRDVCDVRARAAPRQTLPRAHDPVAPAHQNDVPLRGHPTHANDPQPARLPRAREGRVLLHGQRDEFAQSPQAAVADVAAPASPENRGVLFRRARVGQAPDANVLADDVGTSGRGGCLFESDQGARASISCSPLTKTDKSRVCFFPLPHALTEPFGSNRDHDLDLPQTGDAEPRWLHDARLGRAADLRRIASARTRPRVPTASRTANVDLARTHFLLCAHHHHHRYHHRLGNRRHNDIDGSIINDTAPAAPDARAGAPNVARALALCPSKRVQFLVAAAAEEPGPDALSPDRKGDGAVVEAVRRRGQVRNLHARQRVVARIVNFLFFFFFFFFYPCRLLNAPFHISFFLPLSPRPKNTQLSAGCLLI